MSALGLGLIAALCWGFHDICVRFLSRNTPISACIITVLTTGLVFHLGVMGIRSGFTPLTSQTVWMSALAGLFFVIATYGLYHAFERGPVRLVAPIIAGYPIISVGLAAVQGAPLSLAQLVAVLAIVVGVAIVAALSDTSVDDAPPKGPTILYATISAIGFAGTFALGQHAAELSGELPTTLVTRVVAVVVTVAILVLAKQPFWAGKRALPILITMGIADGVALLAVLKAGTLPNAEFAAVASSMFGLLTILLAWVLLRERMTGAQWIGCLIAFVGVGYLAL